MPRCNHRAGPDRWRRTAPGRPRQGVVLVADVGDAVVGAIALERHGTGPDTAFLLRSAVIDPAWRGHGVGGLLTDAALGWVDEVPAPVALLPETDPHLDHPPPAHSLEKAH
jgi:GNAT superfamily N-acetyltransferase